MSTSTIISVDQTMDLCHRAVAAGLGVWDEDGGFTPAPQLSNLLGRLGVESIARIDTEKATEVEGLIEGQA